MFVLGKDCPVESIEYFVRKKIEETFEGKYMTSEVRREWAAALVKLTPEEQEQLHRDVRIRQVYESLQ